MTASSNRVHVGPKYVLTLDNTITGGRVVFRCGDDGLVQLKRLLESVHDGPLSGYKHAVETMIADAGPVPRNVPHTEHTT